NYNYTFAVKPWEPFKKWKPVQKNKNLALVKDFNLYFLPKNMTFTNEYARVYNERQIRNNIVPDYEFAPIYLKKYDWVRTYNVGYDLSKSIKATFSAVNKSIFEEGNHGVDRKTDPDGYREFMDTLRSQVNTLGKTMDYTQNYSLSYNIPFDKFPLTNWITANAKYTGSFNWQRAPFGQSEFGNTIQNNRNLNFTAQANFVNLYNKIPLFKKVLSDGKSGGRANLNMKGANGDEKNKGGKDKEGDKVVEEFKPDKPLDEMTPKERKQFERKKKRWERKKAREKKRKENAKKKVNPIVGTASRLAMSVRNISGTYALNDGTLLPGFNQETRVLGMNNSTTGLSGFVFGKQGYDMLGRRTGYNVAEQATDNNWLVQNANLNRQYTITHSENLSLKATLEPFKDFNINVNVLRNYSINESEFYRWNNTSSAFESQNNFKTAQLTYTTLTMPSAFQKLDREYSSQTFQTLLNNRQTVSQFLGQQNANSGQLPNQYYDG
ncbi:MAG: cell surface protein SprA, partial [Crocinitomicaceae bacterium]